MTIIKNNCKTKSLLLRIGVHRALRIGEKCHARVSKSRYDTSTKGFHHLPKNYHTNIKTFKSRSGRINIHDLTTKMHLTLIYYPFTSESCVLIFLFCFNAYTCESSSFFIHFIHLPFPFFICLL